jgi:hypothetical protein
VQIPIKSGAIVPVLILLPNLIWFLLPQTSSGNNSHVPLALSIAEHIGRAGIIVIPFFYSLDFSRRFSMVALAIGILALLLYYVVWGRYFVGGRTPELMGAALMGIPLPLAVAPVVLLLASSYLMGSWWMAGAAVFFGIAHIWVSALTL